MDSRVDKIVDFLKGNRYKIVEVCDDGCIVIRYQMSIIQIFPSTEDPEFVSMVFPSIEKITDDNRMDYVFHCMQLDSLQKVVKAYPVVSDSVSLVYEFFSDSDESLFYNIEKGISCLIASKVRYNKLLDN